MPSICFHACSESSSERKDGLIDALLWLCRQQSVADLATKADSSRNHHLCQNQCWVLYHQVASETMSRLPEHRTAKTSFSSKMAHRRIPHARHNSSSQKTVQPSLLKTNGRQTLRILIHSITTFGVPCWKSIENTNLSPQTKSSCVWHWTRSGETCHKRASIRPSFRSEEDSEHAWKQMEGSSNTCCANEHWRVRKSV
jgi:hypothetical protein